MAVSKVWVFIEHDGGRPFPMAYELLTKASQLGDCVDGMAAGNVPKSMAEDVGRFGVSTLYVHASEDYATCPVAACADVFTELIKEKHPDLILIGGTYGGRDLAGRLAAQLDAPVISNANNVTTEDGIVVETSIFGATQIVSTRFGDQRPTIVLVRPKSFVASESGGASAHLEQINKPISGKYLNVRITDRVVEEETGPKLEEAAIVVSGGRGLGNPSNFDLLHETAKLLNGAVGASRAVVDAGWVPYALQVGQTGKTVKPNVYIACGISGAMQHTVGMKGSLHIIAINKDSSAPIFKWADLGIVGDALDILPHLIDGLKKKKN